MICMKICVRALLSIRDFWLWNIYMYEYKYRHQKSSMKTILKPSFFLIIFQRGVINFCSGDQLHHNVTEIVLKEEWSVISAQPFMRFSTLKKFFLNANLFIPLMPLMIWHMLYMYSKSIRQIQWNIIKKQSVWNAKRLKKFPQENITSV